MNTQGVMVAVTYLPASPALKYLCKMVTAIKSFIIPVLDGFKLSDMIRLSKQKLYRS